jgi:hypothetical protein
MPLKTRTRENAGRNDRGRNNASRVRTSGRAGRERVTMIMDSMRRIRPGAASPTAAAFAA